MIESIDQIMNSINAWVAVYALLVTLAVLIMISTNNKRKKRYIDWKNQAFNIWVYKIEWERNDDKLLNELFTENERLFKENKVLKQDVTKASILSLILLVFIALFARFGLKKKG